MYDEEKKVIDFDALRLTLASPQQIHDWSHGEVVKPETVNYRTQKPEKDGLFCEKIFGPSKDWECYCGKYKKIRYKGIVCDKCGVEVTRSIVRRERMGHIELAAPCAHIWFLRGVPSRIGLALDLPPQALEKVIYFASFIITEVDEDLKKETLEQIRQEFKSKKQKIDGDIDRELNQFKSKLSQDKGNKKSEDVAEAIEAETARLLKLREERMAELEEIMKQAEQELKDLKPMKIISEQTYQDLSLKYGHIFEAGIGAEAIRELLANLRLDKIVAEVTQALEDASGTQKDKLRKRLRLLENLHKNDLRPEWMVLTSVPVIPPDLRPMVPLDGGRFATSDLNDLYRRIINRNNRLKQLIDLNAPEVISRNEKRMLQEAVDALIDNSARHGKTVVASTGQRRMLKSLADILKGKQGRFRQNLLGKRIDYSGRSVIVVGPKLRLDQCGLPKKMALELFKPFVISRLIREEYVHNVRSANRFIESGREEVWAILEDIVKHATVMLNRAPTLHRLGIQAFHPTLIEGKAIQVHPLVCEAYNADFDGDQMAVHVPLTEEAKWETENLMLASRNLLKPATGDPVAKPTKDIVWGCYYMTNKRDIEKPKAFSSPQEALFAYQSGKLAVQDSILVRPDAWLAAKLPKEEQGVLLNTSAGRLLFNQVLPDDYKYINAVTDTKKLRSIISDAFETSENHETVARLLDKIKVFGLRYLTQSGYSWGMDDVPAIPERDALIEQGDKDVAEVQDQYDMGLLTDSERRSKVIEIWMRVKDQIVQKSRVGLDPFGPIYTMVESGARGSWSQLIQIVGMKGLVTNPSGEIIELPVKGNFKKGFDVLEYFISTHGARKGLSDTALRTANAGYLTRRLIDVSQDVVIREEDCGTTASLTITKKESEKIGLNILDRIKGRYIAADIIDASTKKVLVKKGTLLDNDSIRNLEGADIAEVAVRSVMTCESRNGVCEHCYGWDLAYNRPVTNGTAVGIIAAQSIGEPGTQLTMRTFHTGGVAGSDITQGLPRVEEIFEARTPNMKAFLADVAGKISIEKPDPNKRSGIRYTTVAINYKDTEDDSYPFVEGRKKKADKEPKIAVATDAKVKKGDVLFTNGAGEKVVAKRAGVVTVTDDQVLVAVTDTKKMEYQIPPEYTVLVSDGDLVVAGTQLTDGSYDLRQLHKLKGREAVQEYVVKEIQTIYASQGQKLNDRHIELIARQMFSRVMVTDAGDSDLLPGERLERMELLRINDALIAEGKTPAAVDDLLLGITKVSLSTTSFLSAASFQETARVLISAAIEGRIDRLEGLKENVIIGRLIPAGTGLDKSMIKIARPKKVEMPTVSESETAPAQAVEDTAEVTE